MGSKVKDIQVVPHETIENEYVVRTIFECDTCHSVFHVDHVDKKEAEVFFAKIENKESVVEAVCTQCYHIINLN